MFFRCWSCPGAVRCKFGHNASLYHGLSDPPKIMCPDLHLYEVLYVTKEQLWPIVPKDRCPVQVFFQRSYNTEFFIPVLFPKKWWQRASGSIDKRKTFSITHSVNLNESRSHMKMSKKCTWGDHLQFTITKKMAGVPFTTILCEPKYLQLGVIPPKNIPKDKTCSRDFCVRLSDSNVIIV